MGRRVAARSAWPRAFGPADQLVFRSGGELSVQAGSRRFQFARLGPHQFPNSHDVYMHDMPFKNLFGEDFRFHSAGCVRVQNVRELVHWLLAATPGWPRTEIDRVIRAGERKDARLTAPVRLYWVYVTAWATADGIVQFREDIHHRDGLGTYAARSDPGDRSGFGEWPRETRSIGGCGKAFGTRARAPGAAPESPGRTRASCRGTLDVEEMGARHPSAWRSRTDVISPGCACGSVGLPNGYRRTVHWPAWR
jgi:hypothetical protein